MSQSNKKSNQNQLDEMVNSIKEEIFMGKLKPGEFLPSEKTLANQFQISNLTVRKGLDILVSDKLIEKIPRVGNKVINPADYGIVTVQFAYHRSLMKEAAIQRLLDDFHRIHPNIRVQTLVISSNNYYQMTKELMDRDAIDVLTINYNNYRDFLENDGLDYLESQESNPSIYPFLFDQFINKGQLKVQPFIFSPLILCYNKEHFQQYGIGEPDSSWRWERLFEVADLLALNNERLGFHCFISELNRWLIFFIQSGLSFRRSNDKKIQIRFEEISYALQAVKEIVTRMNRHPMLVAGNGADAEELFFEGKVSMIMTTYFRLNYCENMKVNYDIATLPYLYNQTTTLQTIGLGISALSKVKESAKILVDFLTSHQAQLTLRQQTLSIPAHKLAAEWNGTEMMYRPSRFYLYRDIIPSFRLYTDLNMTERELSEFAKALRMYWSGLEKEETLMKRLESL